MNNSTTAFLGVFLYGIVILPSALAAQDDGRRKVEIACRTHKVVFTQDESGKYIPTTEVSVDGNWVPMFDAGRPILSGPSFDLYPTSFKVLSATEKHKSILFQGRHNKPSYDWDLLVEADPKDSLIKFVVTCHLLSDLTMTAGPEPTAAFWMNKPEAACTVDQGPMSIYRSHSGGVPYGFGFPAAYLWDDGKEAVTFFDFTPVRWMTLEGVARFFNCKVQAIEKDGQTGIGLHTHEIRGRTIPKGDMTVKYYLFARGRKSKPTKMQALDTMIQVCAPLHPAQSKVRPVNKAAPGKISWGLFAGKAIEQLMEARMFYDQPVDPSWDDSPLKLIKPVTSFRIHPGNRATLENAGWDFSTVNNHLSSSILFARVKSDRKKLKFARRKFDGLPLFYDPSATLIRHGTRYPAHVGDASMTWQNFFIHIETLRAHQVTPHKDFNPAVAGRVLMATSGLIEYAHNVDYVFSQYFDPYKKVAMIQRDVPALGYVREPWSVGSYAYVMIQAYEMTGDKKYLKEATSSIDTIMTSMSYKMNNDIYSVTLSDPIDFPITELFGNAYGIVAAAKLHQITGDIKYQRYSRDFLNTLLRLTFWYEDETTEWSRELGNLGLFLAHGGASTTTPWENAEAHLALAAALKYDTGLPITKLLLKLSNIQRVNAFYYFAPTCSDSLIKRGHPNTLAKEVRKSYFPTEPFYLSVEASGGHNTFSAAYMSCQSMWNYWMYEALAEVSNPSIMVLNLDTFDGYEEALSGAERHLIVFNPTGKSAKFNVRMKNLPAGNYDVNITGTSDKSVSSTRRSRSALAQGVRLSLKPMGYARLTVSHESALKIKTQISEAVTAQNRLCHAYQLLQEGGRDRKDDAGLPQQRDLFQLAMQDYRDQKYAVAAEKTQTIVRALVKATQEYMPPKFKVIETGGRPAAGAANLALAAAGAVAFGKDELGSGYEISLVNDGKYGHHKCCWIGPAAKNYVGVILVAPSRIDRIAFGSNNDPGGIYEDRHTGVWQVQCTMDPKPSASSKWKTLGTVMKETDDSPGRNLYEFEPVDNVTAVRLTIDRAGAMVDELEVYATD